MADLQALFSRMQDSFDSQAGADVEAVIQYDIDDGGLWYVTLTAGQCTVVEGQAEDPQVTLSMDGDTLQEVLSGETDGMQAFMAGSVQAEGDVMLAARLGSLFPVS